MTSPQVRALLTSRRWILTDEARLQEEIARVLREAGADVEREVRLDARSRVDMMIGSLAIEVKTQGGVVALVSQLGRYADYPWVSEVLAVVTARRLCFEETMIDGTRVGCVLLRTW